jgi:hypothetical protein
MAKIRGGKVKSMSGLKSSMKKGGGAGYLSRVPADGALTVRFLTEPIEWIEYWEHYDSVRKFYPCSDTCPGCLEGDRPSQRYLANAVDVGETRVIPLVMPKTMAASVLKKYEKYGTLLDRDYELTRSGQGFDTEYEVTPEIPTNMKLDRFDLLDLWELLEGQLGNTGDDDDVDDDDDDDVPAPKSKKRAPAPVDEDDDDEEEVEAEDEDEDGSDTYTRDDLEGMGLRELKRVAKELGWEASDLKGLDADAIIDTIMGEDGADDEDDDDDEEGLTEDDIRAMSLAEVKGLAKEMGVRVKPGTSKDDIIDLILDAASVDEDDDEEVPF